jgi:hypothetical protein
MEAKALPSSLAGFARSFSRPSRMSPTALLKCNVCDVKESLSSWSLILFKRPTGAFVERRPLHRTQFLDVPNEAIRYLDVFDDRSVD